MLGGSTNFPCVDVGFREWGADVVADGVTELGKCRTTPWLATPPIEVGKLGSWSRTDTFLYVAFKGFAAFGENGV